MYGMSFVTGQGGEGLIVAIPPAAQALAGWGKVARLTEQTHASPWSLTTTHHSPPNQQRTTHHSAHRPSHLPHSRQTRSTTLPPPLATLDLRHTPRPPCSHPPARPSHLVSSVRDNHKPLCPLPVAYSTQSNSSTPTGPCHRLDLQQHSRALSALFLQSSHRPSRRSARVASTLPPTPHQHHPSASSTDSPERAPCAPEPSANMREVNFSIPNANKASVSITTALYDRRALDCTSTLPLINSLNNLAYLTTSSGRIRDILTVDGGIERLVCILKEGRSKDMMEMWKWNLAFQCIVNIGVRGSEAVRTRVVEADMVPVIATILDNYFQVIEKCREKAEIESRRKCPLGSLGGSRSFSRSAATRDDQHTQRSDRSRRHVPPPISIPEPREQREDTGSAAVTPTVTAANLSLSSPPDRTNFQRHQHHRSLSSQVQFSSPGVGGSRQASEQPVTSAPSRDAAGTFGLRPVRDIDRLPSMLPTLHAELSSQPQSPTTPSAHVARPDSQSPTGLRRAARRPSIRHQLSISGSDDDVNPDEAGSEDPNDTERQPEPHVDIQSDIVMQDVLDDDTILEPRTDAPSPFYRWQRSKPSNDTYTSTERLSAKPDTPALNPLNATPPNLQQPPAWLQPQRSLPLDRPAPAQVLAAMPRDEDVLMSLQLLAYVSKYCNLRSYFQQSHLVPRLKIGKDLRLLDPDYNPATSPLGPSQEELDEDWDNEFVEKPGEQPYNIFPLIEKFTAKPSTSSRHSSTGPISPQQGEMSYWAGVVMRNLCRKDDSRGGIRQCAYWQCGKWEEYTRQFAKCRRCRRTKYCSKECQKGAWGSHRFWCVAADDGSGRDGGGEGSSDRHHRRHHHHHHHSHHHSHGNANTAER
ncbi:hypothetical protein Q7P37_001717 [Cladosporium fusiforme]